MMEQNIDPEEVESLPLASQTDGATLYDDLIIRRGRSRQQVTSSIPRTWCLNSQIMTTLRTDSSSSASGSGCCGTCL
ncbi:hypothetical protein DPMN_145731 [Dreissena polymorpha]|uniref:Uncharacterized protein n=1 Tax=Dreissena polymorpha TaxID=45954 RepID=A0A9D4F952_DREPO|nr:hypothetical protein DPMN_145731 [Dreissena polymorpha]